MTEALIESAHIIFSEMMVHPGLFTHPHPTKALILGDDDQSILHEVLKHANVAEIYHNHATPDQHPTKKTIISTNQNSIRPHSIDIIINATDSRTNAIKHLFDLLHHDGILIQQSVSPFAMKPLKSLITDLHQTGFSDLQLLSFPQPSYTTGWRSIMMALKNGMFKRLREKVIYNKTFETHYYNFDVHKAASVLPEFMRNNKLF